MHKYIHICTHPRMHACTHIHTLTQLHLRIHVACIPTQGIKWVVNREEPLGLVVIQQSQHKYIDKVGAGVGVSVSVGGW